MRLSLSREINGNRGIDHFLQRLTKELVAKYDVKIVSKKQKSDVHLSIIRGEKRGAKNVLRLDGVYYDKKRLKNNFPIARAIRKADGVVYQSNWAKKFVTGMLKVRAKKDSVIYNGFNQSMYKNVNIDKNGFDKIFIACAHWRVNKRPHDIIDSFISANKKSNLNLGLYFVGKYKKKIKHPNIKYYGTLVGKKLFSLYKSADYLVHICHLDACSNSVVEALSAGCAVLSNNIGGTPELTKEDGIILPLDKEFNFRPINRMEDVGYIDKKMLTQGMIDMTKINWNINRPDLDISVTAKGYYKFFKKVLER